jgi:hypothetical protein
MCRPHLLLALVLAATAAAQGNGAPAEAAPGGTAPLPQTVPEATDYKATSRAEDVQRFVHALATLPRGGRLSTSVAGKSHEGRAMLCVKVSNRSDRQPQAGPQPKAGQQPKAEHPAGKLRALVIGNIHAGEVEGKEAIQVLLREFALGEHDDLLQALELWFVPVYNVDGNEKIDARNRTDQNGPDAVGARANGQGLDLNRDFVKAEAPETRALLALWRDLDPHLFFDLHTTDGSAHGYHLTCAPTLATGVDDGIAAQSRALLDAAAVAMRERHGFAAFDYGNFETRGVNDVGAAEAPAGTRGWFSYDHRARYGVNCFGLRNRIAILAEAYSYADFRTRIAATRAFVLEVLRAAAADAAAVRSACALADRRLTEPDGPRWFGFDTTFAEPELLPVLVGEVLREDHPSGRGRRLVRKGDGVPETMPVYRRFRSRQQIALPAAWALRDPPPEVLEVLAVHGVQHERLAAPLRLPARVFAVTQKRKPKRPYQGHQELVLQGNWQPEAMAELPAGTLLVRANQPLGRLCAQLLEPQSEDSLSTWNFLEPATSDTYPVLRLTRLD